MLMDGPFILAGSATPEKEWLWRLSDGRDFFFYFFFQMGSATASMARSHGYASTQRPARYGFLRRSRVDAAGAVFMLGASGSVWLHGITIFVALAPPRREHG